MLETKKTYAECDPDERVLIERLYGGALPDSAIVHVDRGHLVVESLNLADVARMDTPSNRLLDKLTLDIE